GHVQAPDAAADRRRERPLERDAIMADRVDGAVRQPLAAGLPRLLAREHLEPGDRAGTAVGLRDGAVEGGLRRAPDVGPGAVPFDEGHDRPIGHFEPRFGLVPVDLSPVGGRRHVVESAVHDPSWCDLECAKTAGRRSPAEAITAIRGRELTRRAPAGPPPGLFATTTAGRGLEAQADRDA